MLLGHVEQEEPQDRAGKNGAKSFPGARPWMISH